ncbi:MAG: general secretion pathway protein GspD [Pirellulales bacterium]|nr:general secretion pathway protein GspD [Pirellulales bacterium]
MKTTARMLTGWVAVGTLLTAGIIVAGPPWGTTQTVVGAASVAQADPSATASQGQRSEADDLLRRARKAMAENDLEAADSLISQADAMNVKYNFLHLGDTPKKARRDLQKMQDAAQAAPQRPSQLFSQLSLKEKPPQVDPFASRTSNTLAASLTDKKGLAESYIVKARTDLAQGNLSGASHWYRMASKQPATFGPGEDSPEKLAADIRRAGGNVDQPMVATAVPDFQEGNPLAHLGYDSSPGSLGTNRPTQSPFGRALITAPPSSQDQILPTALTSPDVGPTPGPTTGLTTGLYEGSSTGDARSRQLLLEARRALAVGDIARATAFVGQTKQLQVAYGPLDDTPAKVEAAVAKYQDLSGRTARNTEAYRRAYARMLMEQADALMRAADYDEAERLADRASRQQLTYGPFEAKPSDLLARIAAARRQGQSSADSSAPGVAMVESSSTAGPSLAARQKADQLVRQARAALATSQIELAETLAYEAERLQIPDAAYAPGEDRAGLVLFDVRKARQQNPSGVIPASGSLVTPATGPWPSHGTATRALYDSANDPTRNLPAGVAAPTPFSDSSRTNPVQLQFAQNIPAPPSVRDGLPSDVSAGRDTSASSLFQQGEAALKAHDKQSAYQFFRQAAEQGNQLDPITQQRLQSYLQLLSPPRPSTLPGGPARSIADEAAARQQVLARQVSADVAQQEARARAMLESDPKAALSLLEETRQKVEAAALDPSARQQLLMRVNRQLTETRQFIELNQPRIELTEKNDRTREEIEREQRLDLETQEKFALMVDDFNTKMDEQRFAEAEVVAKRAAELDPDNPVVKQLLLRSKFVRRYFNNLELSDLKEEGLWSQLDSVAASSVGFDDRIPFRMPDAKEWADLTTRRSKYTAEQQRHRTERDLEIEQKLRHPVSLDFREEPLANVLDYLAKVTEVNMHLDPQALAEYGISADVPVTISVRDEIMLKSALNLILEPLQLTYVVKDEVLKVTSEQQREGETHRFVYSVADLVTPIPNFVPSPNMGLAGAYHNAMSNVGYGMGASFGASAAPLAVMASRDGNPGAAMINPALLAQVSGPASRGGGSMPMGFGPGGLGGGSQADFDSLIDLITSTIQPDTWDDVGGPGSIAPFETNLSLVVSQTQDVHEEIVDLLEQLRRLQDLQVTIEVRFITLNDNFFERIGVDFDFDIDDDIDRPLMVFGRKVVDDTGADDSDPTTGQEATRNTLDVDHDRSVTVGMQAPGVFSADLDIPFTQNSYGLAVPQFGGFDASAGASLGFAILSDIEAFFFINAASGDRRSNVLQAPKVTLFNGQQAYVSDTSQSPFVVSVIPVVGDFAAAQQPVIVILSEGTFMTVQAVVSNDRRFVRLTVVPFFSKIGEVNTFQFTGSQTTTTDTSTEGVVDPDNANPDSPNNSSSNVTQSRQGTTVQLPTFSYVTVTTTVSVPDGGTVLLGGIKRLSEGRNEFGVPILKNIPYVNRLFKNVGIGRETQSLMMMVTPRIIIQEEEEDRLGILSPP